MGWQGPAGEGGGAPGGSGQGGGGSSGGGSSGGGGGGGAHGNFVHNDQMLKVFFGYDASANEYNQEVPGEWEARQQCTTGLWLESDRMFGAFVVANRNDSDSDQIEDYKDSSVVGNSRAAEPDLIKLVITIPEWGPQYECSVEAFHTNFITNSTTSTESIRFFGSKTKGSLIQAGITPWPGSPVDIFNPTYTPADGFSITQAGVYTVYAEVHAASEHICDYTVIVELRTPESATSNGEFDQVNVTAIWAEEHKFVNDRTELEIVQVANSGGDKVIYHQLPVNGGPQVALPAGLEVGDYIVIYDDNWTPDGFRAEIYNGGLWVSNTQNVKQRSARQWVMARIEELQVDGGIRISFPNQPEGVGKGTRQIITPFDRFAYALNKHVKPNQANLSWLPDQFSYQAAAIIGANMRETPNWKNGVEISFAALPIDIMKKQMSNGEYVQFDIARQAHGGVLWKNGNNWQKVEGIVPQFYPTQDEIANDDSAAFPANYDECTSSPRDTAILTVIDVPGIGGNVPGSADQKNRFAFLPEGDGWAHHMEFKEFVRVRFDGEAATFHSPGDNILWGSRCSEKLFWHNFHTAEHNPGRPHNFNGQNLYYGRFIGGFPNKIEPGRYIDGNELWLQHFPQ